MQGVSANRVAAAAAVAAAVIWGLKAIVIWIAGGLDESPLESPLFILGLIAIVVAGAALGVAVVRGRPAPVKALAGIGGVLVTAAFCLLVQAAVKAIAPESAGWVEEEAGLWVASGATAVLAVAWLRSRERSPRGVLST